jgi:hypothetical protein
MSSLGVTVAYAPAGSLGAGSPAYDMVYGITQLMSADVTEVIKGNNVATDTVTYIVYPQTAQRLKTSRPRRATARLLAFSSA